MIYVLIANITAFIASLILIYTGYLKDKKQILLFQIIQFILFIISYLLLGAFTGVILNFLGIIRNTLSYFKKLSKPFIFILSILSIIFTIKYNTFGLIGLLPLIGVILYTCFMNTENIIKFKLLIINALVLSTIYDIVVMSYSSAVFNIITIILSINAIYKIKTNLK